MKIKGPGDGAPPIEGAKPEAATSRTAFAERLEGAQAASAAGAPGDPAALAGALRSGQLTPKQALGEIIAHCVDEQIGKSAPPAVRERMVAAMTELCNEDPLFAEKLQRIGAKLAR